MFNDYKDKGLGEAIEGLHGHNKHLYSKFILEGYLFLHSKGYDVPLQSALYYQEKKDKHEFKVGQKVFADTETRRASCNISSTRIKQQVTISYYDQKENTYCCREFNENIAPYQLSKI